jgi:hypothetical protein
VVLGQARTTEHTELLRPAGGALTTLDKGAITTLDKEFVDVAAADVSADAAGSVNQRVVLQIPPRAAPSAGLEVQWRVVGLFDETIVEGPVFKVLVPRETFLDLLGRPGWSARPGEEHPHLRLEAGDRCVRCGDAFHGRLVFTPAKDTRVRNASVRLECSLPADDRTLFDERAELGGDIEVARGETREFPFSIPIPHMAAPTAWDATGSADDPEPVVTWYAYGTLKTGRLLGETELYAPIHVYNGL